MFIRARNLMYLLPKSPLISLQSLNVVPEFLQGIFVIYVGFYGVFPGAFHSGSFYETHFVYSCRKAACFKPKRCSKEVFLTGKVCVYPIWESPASKSRARLCRLFCKGAPKEASEHWSLDKPSECRRSFFQLEKIVGERLFREELVQSQF